MSRTIFITATDTDAGKTWVTRSLLQRGLEAGLSIQALKPIASGMLANGLNEDVDILLSAQVDKQASDINFITYDRPLAPALAGEKQHKHIQANQLLTWQNKQVARHDMTLIEGVGGVMVPLSIESQPWLVSDWIQATEGAEVMLVAPLKLGCMNQILIHCTYLEHIGCAPGWIILNDLNDTHTFDETQAILQPILQDRMAQVPEMICLSANGAIPNILV